MSFSPMQSASCLLRHASRPAVVARRALLLSLTFGDPQLASAAGFQIAEQNASGIGTVYAGQPALADDASVVFYNPAGMSFLSGSAQYVEAFQLVKPTTTFSDTGSCTPFVGTSAGTRTCPFGRNGNLGHAGGSEGKRSADIAPILNLYGSLLLIPDRL